MTGRAKRRMVVLAFLVLGAKGAFAQTLFVDPRNEFAKAMDELGEAREIQTDQRDRARRLFRSAAKRLEGVVSAGVTNGKLEYNLGNCYLQGGDIGRAILHYRRAERLIPSDPWLADNLREARSRRLTSINAKASSRLLRGLLFLHYDTSPHVRAVAAIVFYIALWCALILRNAVKRRWVTVTAVLCFCAVSTLGISVGVNRWLDRHAPEGVVIAMDVVANKGPGSGFQRKFEEPLQPGVEFTLRGRRAGWFNIELPDGKTGWIEATAAELIPSEAG